MALELRAEKDVLTAKRTELRTLQDGLAEEKRAISADQLGLDPADPAASAGLRDRVQPYNDGRKHGLALQREFDNLVAAYTNKLAPYAR